MTSTSFSRSEQYNGKVTPVGNSTGIRLDAAFFKAHPEFNGDVCLTVLASGQVLLSAKNTASDFHEDNDADSVMLGFLQFIEKQMIERLDLIEPADHEQLVRIGQLVKGVNIKANKS
jgi:hypothetical protein